MNEIKHIAIIMDGNGRWAKKRGMPRSYGHKQGEASVKRTIEKCYKEGIETLSLFAFSTENWKREESEVNTLFEILAKFLARFEGEAIKREICVRIMGDFSKLPSDLQEPIASVIEKTKNFKKLTVNIGLNYGGRDEILRAVNLAVDRGMHVDAESFKTLLYTDGLPDPDIVIRTSGEFRLSNFMIYQCAYSELYFTDVLWPDFDEKELDKAIESFKKRDRRFGKITK
ncbi:MAG: polyprenyl diphosphate synthase [Clostridia bacterium]